MARTFSALPHRQAPCRLRTCIGWWSVSPGVANFSSTRASAIQVRYTNKRRDWERKYPEESYPGFRDAAPEHRLVRENQLFNPIEHKQGDGDQLRAFQASLHTGSTLPLRLASTSELEREMLYLATRSDRGRKRVSKILSILLPDREEEPKALHYETLIALNAEPYSGSAASIQKLLEEMHEQKIACDVNTYTSVLRSLVVHPDVEILNRVLDGCTALWIELDTEMLHYVTAIYLRLGMSELALDYLDRIEGRSRPDASSTNTDLFGTQPGQAELWLYILFINQLVERNEWDGVARICYRLNDDPSIGPFAMRQLDIPYSFWHDLLQQSLKHRDLWVSLWIWNTWVIRRWFRPTFATCTAALNLFVKHGLKVQAYGATKMLRSFRTPSNEPKGSTYIQRRFSPAYKDWRSSIMRKRRAMKEIMRNIETAEEEFCLTVPVEEQARIAAHWVVFEHGSGSKIFAPEGLRINPWSLLWKEGADPGHLWARIATERQEDRKYALRIGELRRKKHNKEAKRAAVSDGLSALPVEARADLNKMANMDFDLRLSKLENRQYETIQSVPSIEDDDESLTFDEEDAFESMYGENDSKEEEHFFESFHPQQPRRSVKKPPTSSSTTA